ncbi:unnamed protein product [Pedinophyceae sp. YPF-701]|nr:unnamed protein product [Pedinophyceae sp. YPF-701]
MAGEARVAAAEVAGEGWRMPAEVRWTLVEEETQMEEVAAALSDALFVGIDCEWKPGTKVPKALLLQLAVRRAEGPDHVFLLDLKRLPEGAARPTVQAMLRNDRCVKVGYSIVGDLKAIAVAFGGEGAGCVRATVPYLEIGAVSKHLRKHVADLRGCVKHSGLSGLVAAHLGAPLDKGQQCSQWHVRPLTPEQIAYAAADAHVLLALTDALVAACGGAPLRHPMFPARGAASGSDSDGSGGAEAWWVGLRARCRARGGESAGGSRRAVAEDVALAWGIRLQMSGGKKIDFDGSDRLPKGKRRGARAGGTDVLHEVRGGGGNGAEEDFSELPSAVPWEDPRDAKFLCDTMLEGLARQLRLFGFDAASPPAAATPPGPSDKSPKARTMEGRFLAYRAMVEAAHDERRLILTQDRTFLRTRYTGQAMIVGNGLTKQQQLQEVVERLGLQVSERRLMSRCFKCNGEFDDTPVGPENLPRGHGLPAEVLAEKREFWVCRGCKQVYWEGGVFDKALEGLAGRFEDLRVTGERRKTQQRPPCVAPPPTAESERELAPA